jgi:HlyD family secretion protein
MRRGIRIAAVAGLVLAVGAMVAGWRAPGNSAPSPATDTLALYGNVDVREVSLAFNGVQRIDATLVEEGAFVHKGDILATLDRRHLLADVARSQAVVDAQRHRVEELRAGTRPADIHAAEARLEAARARKERTARDAERMQRLFERNNASPQQRDTARADAEMAAAGHAEAEQLLALAREGPRAEEIAAAQSTLEADEADLALARHRLEDAILRAPADGVIRNRLLEAGDMSASDRPVFTLALTRPLWVRAYVDEVNLGNVRPGQRAWVSTDAFPGRRFAGWIGFISPTAEFTPKPVQTPVLRTQLVYEVRILVCNQDGDLRLGMPATVAVPLTQAPADASPSCNEGQTGETS